MIELYSVIILVGIIVTIIIKKRASGATYSEQRPNLTDKYAIITGGNTGIGKEVAKEFVRLGCNVIICARDRTKGQQTIKEIKKIYNHANIEFISIDLADRQSIQNFAKQVMYHKIDYLINNAGIMMVQSHKFTINGFEFQYGVNHLGHFYLTYLLWNKLNQSQFFRVINVSSNGHNFYDVTFRQTKLDFQNMNFQKGGYAPVLSYSRSKLCNVLFTKALVGKILKGKGFTASLHPGVVRTELVRQIAVGIKYYLFMLIYPIFCLFTKTPLEGAQTIFYTAFSKNIINGQYYSECKVDKMNSFAKKQENWEKLWKISQDSWGIKF